MQEPLRSFTLVDPSISTACKRNHVGAFAKTCFTFGYTRPDNWAAIIGRRNLVCKILWGLYAAARALRNMQGDAVKSSGGLRSLVGDPNGGLGDRCIRG